MEDFNNCPIGIKNEKEIDKVEKVFEMAINRLEEKIDDIKDDVNTGFANVDVRFNAMEDRFNSFEENLDSKIDDRITNHDEKRASKIVKWVLVSLLGATAVMVFGRYVLIWLGLA